MHVFLSANVKKYVSHCNQSMYNSFQYVVNYFHMYCLMLLYVLNCCIFNLLFIYVQWTLWQISLVLKKLSNKVYYYYYYYYIRSILKKKIFIVLSIFYQYHTHIFREGKICSYHDNNEKALRRTFIGSFF